MIRFFKVFVFVLVLTGGMSSLSVAAQTIPGSADAGRIDAAPEDILPPQDKPQIILPESITPDDPMPEDAETLRFVLNDVTIEGMTAFSRNQVADIYQDELGQEIPLSRVWDFAARLTALYQAEGYFLSRAYIPAQEIDQGEIILRVVEGYIGDVQIEDRNSSHYLIEKIKTKITEQRPAQMKKLEHAILLLNDLPGLEFEAVLRRLNDTDTKADGAVRLILKQNKTPARGNVLLNNHGSRFTGPHRASFAYEQSFLPLQRTAISGIANLPAGDELKAVSAQHEISLLPRLDVEFSLGRTVSKPGHTLDDFDIESRSVNWGVALGWQAVRQRQRNVNLSLSLEGRNVNTDLLDTPLIRDRIRVLRAHMLYDGTDPFGGDNRFDLTLSQGLSGLGASDKGDQNLSRTSAAPDFSKIELFWQRQQFVAQDWLVSGSLRGQYASKALYSSEEFGFGGPFMGRAYDSSEIIGDHGVGAALEVHYTGLPVMQDVKITPSVFYDMGKIWNIDAGQENALSAANAGFGVNLLHPSGVTASFSVAVPLTKSIDTPIYGGNGHSPRLYFQLGRQF
ncbi:MAG: ShlB/FhaC/HecB family hemolysin secretion/activation protein [Pseudomonadota bacterium]